MTINIKIAEIDDVITLINALPEFDKKNSYSDLVDRLADSQHLILVAFDNHNPIGFKIGYALSSKEFYSWLGGVLPEYRKMGIASSLRKYQEKWAIENKFQQISVKSMNRYPAMLQLLISSGYQIVGYEDNGSSETSKIKFLKHLCSNN